MKNKQTLGQRLRAYRIRKRLTQAELAEKSSVSQSMISRLECESIVTPGIDIMGALEKALGAKRGAITWGG